MKALLQRLLEARNKWLFITSLLTFKSFAVESVCWYHCVRLRNTDSTEENIRAEHLLMTRDQVT